LSAAVASAEDRLDILELLAAVLATSTLLIVAPGAPPQLQSVSAISQLVVKIGGGWRIARRTVHLL
jgi:hypothetical protein